MGTCAERIIARHGISRDEQDAYSEQSYTRAKDAWERGTYEREVTPITLGDQTIERDEEMTNRPKAFSSLRPLFEDPKVGSVTFGNTSKLGDGACALLLASEASVEANGMTPMARIVGHADAAAESIDFTTAVVYAIEKLLAKYKGFNLISCTIAIGTFLVEQHFYRVDFSRHY